MTRKASGASASAPAAASCSPNTEATEAATIPWGAIQATKAPSRQSRSERRVEISTAAGRTTSSSTSKNARAPPGVTTDPSFSRPNREPLGPDAEHHDVAEAQERFFRHVRVLVLRAGLGQSHRTFGPVKPPCSPCLVPSRAP